MKWLMWVKNLGVMQWVYIAVAALIGGLVWGVRHEQGKAVDAQNALTELRAQMAQAAKDQKDQQQRDQLAADLKLAAAEAQREQDAKDHQQLVDSLAGRLRRLQAALDASGMPGTVAHPGPVQGGSGNPGEGGGGESVAGRFTESIKALADACLATDDDKHAIINAEPVR